MSNKIDSNYQELFGAKSHSPKGEKAVCLLIISFSCFPSILSALHLSLSLFSRKGRERQHLSKENISPIHFYIL